MPMRVWLVLTTLTVLLCAPVDAHAQRDPAVDRLIEQLRPGPPRGIRMPSEPPTTDVSGAAPATTAPAGRRRPQAEAGTAAIRVRFATGSATLSPEAERSLDILGRALASGELAAYRFRIEGHTDRVGSTAINQALSERRAAAVRDYLGSRHGIAAARLEVVGRGEDEPEVATADEIPDPRNRRVRVVNLGT